MAQVIKRKYFLYPLIFLGIFLIFASGFYIYSQQTTIDRVSLNRVVDGDTIIVDNDLKTERVRLLGINAPESVNPDESVNTQAGADASEYLKSILQTGQTLYIENDVNQDDKDKYGRLLRYVWIDLPSANLKNMVNYNLIKTGYAQVNFYGHDISKYYLQFKLAEQGQ